MRGRGAAVRHRLTPTVAVDPLAEAVELLAVGVMMPFTVKPPDIPPLEMDPKGALSGSLRNARMMVKSRGGTLKPLVPRRHLPSKVASWRRLALPGSCSLHSGHRLIANAPSGHAGLLCSAWCKEVEVPHGHLECCE
jgi:hypothetical protein